MEQLREAVGGRGSPSPGRSQRLSRLLDELIAVLRHGGVDEQAPGIVTTVDPEVDSEDRELVRRYVVEGIEHHQFEASSTEAAIISEWALDAELRRVRNENHLLHTLLDAV